MSPQNTSQWGDPDVSEMMLLQENVISYPSTDATVGGTPQTLMMQRSGFLSRLRFLAQAQINCTVFAAATTQSVLGVLGAYINRIRIEAAGKIPLIDLSGLGVTMLNELQNRDGSVLAPPAFQAAAFNTQVAATSLQLFNNITAAAVYTARAPFEFQFALPVKIREQLLELGLWLLQDQAIDVGIQVTFNPMYSVAANINALWHTAAGNTVAAVPANSTVQIERELYTLPREKSAYPDTRWAHQVIEYRRPIVGGFCRFEVPRSGILLRAATLTLGATGVQVDTLTDIRNQSWIYGANESPIVRPGWAFTDEYVQDHGCYPMAGFTMMDFYKWGDNGFKFAKNTDALANLRIETNFNTTTTGTQVILLDQLVPVGAK